MATLPPRTVLALRDAFRRYGAQYLPTDPVELVRGYHEKRDVELAGVLAAGMAFGNAQAVRASARRVLDRLGPHPAAAIAAASLRELDAMCRGTGHRWLRAGHVAAVLAAVADAQRGHGDLETLFLRGDAAAEPHLGAAMDAFVAELPALRPLFAPPSAGSACKRFCLFLRWMVRGPDDVDLGAWRQVSPARLTIPLDVHLARVSRRLGLTRRKSDDWKAAREITAALARVDRRDPLKFDFALCRVGMVGGRRLAGHALEVAISSRDGANPAQRNRRDPKSDPQA